MKTLSATVTWLGNSFSGDKGSNYFPDTLKDIAVSADGTVMTGGNFNEAFPQTVFIKNGQFVSSATWQFESEAVTYDKSSNTFIAGVLKSGGLISGSKPISPSGGIVGPAWFDTQSPRFWQHELQKNENSGGRPVGFAFSSDSDLIYTSDAATGRIEVFRKSDSAKLPPLAVSGTGKLQMVGKTLWAIQGTKVVAIDPATGVVTRSLSSSSSSDDVLAPASLTVDKWGRLLVGDVAPSRRRIAIFDPATGKRVGTFGKIGGPWGPESVSGRLGSGVFERPVGLGVDAAGNLYVGDAGGAWPQHGSVSCYKPLATAKGWGVTPLWRAEGSSWCDNVAVDPSDTTTLYSAFYKYRFDYNAAPGKGGQISANTFDFSRYPGDARANVYTLGRQFRGLRVIEGKKFLYSGKMDVFRLGDAGAGDVAVPCCVLLPRNARFEYGLPGWPQNVPSYNDPDGWVWTDANKDGQFQAEEYRRFSSGEFHSGTWNQFMYLDDAATVWYLPTKGDRRGFFYRMQGLRNDAPYYDDVTTRTPTLIPSGDGLGQINYSSLNEKTGDLLILSRRDGRSDMSLTCYANWRALALAGKGDTATIRYRVDGVAQGPAINTDGGYSGDFIGGMRAKNEYLFLADAVGMGIRVYQVDTGAAVGRLDPGALGGTQPMDNTEGLQVSTRGAGKTLEYVITRDGWLTNKILLYRWKPMP